MRAMSIMVQGIPAYEAFAINHSRGIRAKPIEVWMRKVDPAVDHRDADTLPHGAVHVFEIFGQLDHLRGRGHVIQNRLHSPVRTDGENVGIFLQIR